MSATKEKIKESAGKKTGRGKKALKIIGIILGIIVCFVVVTTVISKIGNAANMKKVSSFKPVEYEAQLVPEKDARGNYSFVTDGDLKVLQLTDVHVGGGWLCLKKDGMAINAVAAMITAEKPDLVIVTGDIAYPVPFQAGTFNNKPPAKMFAELMEKLGVYWTLAFGNHDTELYSFFDREEIGSFYSGGSYPHCLFMAGPSDVDGCGNQIITVKNTKGVVTQLLYLLDSHSYTGGDFLGIMQKYDNIHQNQIDWYAKTLEEYQDDNNSVYAKLGVADVPTLKSSMFFHIPLKEFREGWKEYVENGMNDTENVKYYCGIAGEHGKVIFTGIGEDEVFETVLALGSTQAIFCGHDHYNDFSLEYKGVRLTYGKSIDYLAYPGIYKVGAQRGCTVITFAPDGSFDMSSESYYQDKYTSLYEKETVDMTQREVLTDLPW